MVDTGFSGKHGKEAEAVFNHIDTNSDGRLDARELQCRLSDFGVEVCTIIELLHAAHIF